MKRKHEEPPLLDTQTYNFLYLLLLVDSEQASVFSSFKTKSMLFFILLIQIVRNQEVELRAQKGPQFRRIIETLKLSLSFLLKHINIPHAVEYTYQIK